MDLIADILLGAGALGAAFYCMVLSRRLQRLTRLESGMGGAIALLSAQVDDLTRMLSRAESSAKTSSDRLEAQTRRAEDAVKRLEILLATLSDLPPAPVAEKPAQAAAPAPAAAPAEAPAAVPESPVAPRALAVEPAAPAPVVQRTQKNRIVARRRSRREVEEVA